MSDIGKQTSFSSLLSPTYQAYLVRLWRENDHAPWRITVKHVQTQELHHFTTLDDYIAFLSIQISHKEFRENQKNEL